MFIYAIFCASCSSSVVIDLGSIETSLSITPNIGTLEEIRHSLEEHLYLCFIKNIWEYTKVKAKFAESFKIHKSLMISIILVIWQNNLMDAA